MPIASAVNDLWEVKVLGEIDSQLTANVLHFKTVGASADVQTDLIAKLLTCFTTHLLPVLILKWILKEIRYKQVAPALGNEQILTVGGILGTGALGGDALPSFVSAVLSLRTNQGGRSHRGRMYIAGLAESSTLINDINAADPLWAGLLAFANCLITEFYHPDPVGGGPMFDLGVYSRKLGGAKAPYGAAGFTAVTNIVPHLELATMRSRKKGHGA